MKTTFFGKVDINFRQFGFIENTDIFIDKKNLINIFDKDLVEYEIYNKFFFNKETKTFIKKPNAKIIKIVKRNKEDYVVEVIQNNNNHIIAKFKNPKILETVKILINEKIDIGQNLFIKLKNFNKPNLKGIIIKNLGHKTSFNNDLNTIIHDLNIRNYFPEICLEEEKKLLKTKFETYLDLSHLTFFTIDPSDAKDFDDAIYVKKNKNEYKLLVAISDVWTIIKNSPNIEEEALKRGNSIYFFNEKIPMLPKHITNNLSSLIENENRNAIVVEIIFDLEGNLKSNSIYPAIIKNHKRLTYDQVNEWYKKKNKLFSPKIEEKLLISFELFSLTDEIRNKKGYLKINKASFHYDLNDKNEIFNYHVSFEDYSQKLIESFMVAANLVVGNFFKKNKIPTIFRHHEEPTQLKIENLIKNLQELNFLIPKNFSNNVSIKSINDLFSLNLNNKNIEIAKMFLLQSMQKAKYCDDKYFHFGLNVKNYLHFTSPIRRMADLIVHKLLWLTTFEKSKYSETRRMELFSNLKTLSEKITHLEIKNSEAEYSLIKEKIKKFILNKKNELFSAQVVNKTKYGVFVKINNIYETFLKTEENIKLGDIIHTKYNEITSVFEYIKK